MNAPRTAVVIPFALVGADQNPNAAKLAASEQLNAYARGAAVTFASIHRWSPELDLVWCTNGPVPPALEPVLELLNLQVETIPFSHEPPDGYMSAFRGCLFMLDAIAHDDARSCLYLDPDVVAIRPLERMLDRLDGQLGLLPMGFPREEDVNGMTWNTASDYARTHGLGSFNGFVGGEAVWVPASRRRGFAESLEAAHRTALEEFAQGHPHPTTEEHLISLVMGGEEFASLEPDVRRIWTTSRYRTVRGDERGLSLWHLPAEKDSGFARLYPDVLDKRSWFYQCGADEFRDRVGRAMSLHHRTGRKFARDLLGTSANGASRLLDVARRARR